MKCTNKIYSFICITLIACIFLSGCGAAAYDFQYERNMVSSAYMITESGNTRNVLSTFSQNLCVDAREDITKSGLTLENSYASGLFDLSNRKILHATNQFEELPPASITKIMTALVALKYGNLDDEIHVSGNCKITESGATLFGIKEGDI